MGRRQFAAHRWLTVIVSVQLFLWSLGGLIFATHNIEWVRGNDGRSPLAKGAPNLNSILVSPADALTKSGITGPIESMEIRTLLGGTVYEIHGDGHSSVVDATSGVVLTPIDQATATRIALRDRKGSPGILGVVRIEKDPPTEYRGRPLPAFQIEIDDGEGTFIYVAADTGHITARRNDAWRRFDFFWMLHTMDYGGRDDFNTWLLIGFATLGLLAVLSGWVLWGARLVRHFRKRRKRASPRAS